MATLNFVNYSGTTLHHWAGLYDGRYDKEDLVKRHLQGDSSDIADRIRTTDILVIDEIGMVSKKTFETLEYICRMIRNPFAVFGGIQVIASGDFKQLPPVPNYMHNDAGEFSFEAEIFKTVFPHHMRLNKVMRQKENDLIQAVNELCNGEPSKETEALLKGMGEPLSGDEPIVRIFGTNFDVDYYNQLFLDSADGIQRIYKAKDEGQKIYLQRSSVPKILVLKEGSPVILVRNISNSLLNGTRGVVHALPENGHPVINFVGKYVPLPLISFEVFDSQCNMVVATRIQYPVRLAYAITVHRAQGQSLDRLEIDCYSFFSPGQMGVSVGRATSKEGLRILNYNPKAARLKHPQGVYDIDSYVGVEQKEDISCCKVQNTPEMQWDDTMSHRIANADAEIKTETEGQECAKGTCCADTRSEDDGQAMIDKANQYISVRPSCSKQTDLVNCPFSLNAYINKLKLSNDKCLSVSPEARSRLLIAHTDSLYARVSAWMDKDLKTSASWSNVYKLAHAFLTSDEHINMCRILFQVEVISKEQNKFSSKLLMWLLEMKIQTIESDIKQKQAKGYHDIPVDLSTAADTLTPAAKGKIRYVAGACIHKIKDRLRQCVIRNTGRFDEESKFKRRVDYLKQQLLLKLRIEEAEIKTITNLPHSLCEIEYRQGKSRGLSHVRDDVFLFFVKLNSHIQSKLVEESFHLHGSNIHTYVKGTVCTNADLIASWLDLFHTDHIEGDLEVDDDIFAGYLIDLFEMVSGHFLKIAFVDSLKELKESIPRRKRQALRPKLQALNESRALKRKSGISTSFQCSICKRECVDNPPISTEYSIACDSCNLWFHFVCVGLTGNEEFIKQKDSVWKCQTCLMTTMKGKEIGKGKGKGKKSNI
ncbi:hypothetical protein ACJMK2_019590 [Sinanodonta woodiana]|uniref:ATP-dependent DNA helicase n=1 Tax=Sinanodonta woodiana TaxID=1069815 RepID=A0ABD3TXA8_SINWO